MKYLLIALLAILAIGCRSVEYVEVVKTDTLRTHSYHRDSVYKLDSITTIIYTQGDTIYRDREVYRYRDKIITKVDTLQQVAIRKVPIIVEKKLTTWQAFKIEAGDWLLGLIVLVVIVKILLRIRNK